jgi:uncharacterized protein (TIGR02646 family)
VRAIKKADIGGYHLQQQQNNPPSSAAQATSRWHSFNDKANVRQSLLNEQFQLCCYSEIRADELGLGFHIEHIENKSQNPSRTFDYSNLAASALNIANDLQAFNAQGKEVFGGHASGKQKGVDIARFISCQQTNCHMFFSYLSDGRVVPAQALSVDDNAKAQYTIDLLNLNSPYLVTLRQSWWDELDILFAEHQTKGWDFSQLAAIDLTPTYQGLSRFFSLTRQFYGSIAEQIISSNTSLE